MRIVHGSKGGGADVSVQCCVCRKMVPIQESLMDLDGPAFQAYYHAQCLVEAREEELA